MAEAEPEARPSSRGPVAWLAKRARTGTIGQASGTARVFFRVFGPLIDLWWRASLHGWDRLPRDRACLVVANHSGGGIAEVVCLVRLLMQRDPPPRLTGMAHPVAFFVPIFAFSLRGLGAIPSTYEDAERALASGCHVLVFPGGDHEAFRPIWQANQVDFAGRKGFLRLARKANVPIVPLGVAGSHYTLPVLGRSRLLPWIGVLPRLLGIKRLPYSLGWVAGLAALVFHYGTTAGPAAAALAAWAWAFLPLASFIPFVPWRIRMAVGEPIEAAALFGTTGGSEQWDTAYGVVTQGVQAQLDRARGL